MRRDAAVARLGTDQVAVVEHDRSCALVIPSIARTWRTIVDAALRHATSPGRSRRIRRTSARLRPTGTSPSTRSCAEVWPDDVGDDTAREQLCRRLSAALPRRPIEVGARWPSRRAPRPCRCAACEIVGALCEEAMAMRLAIRSGSISTHRITAPAIHPASGCAPPMPPRPAVGSKRPGEVPSKVALGYAHEYLVVP